MRNNFGPAHQIKQAPCYLVCNQVTCYRDCMSAKSIFQWLVQESVRLICDGWFHINTGYWPCLFPFLYKGQDMGTVSFLSVYWIIFPLKPFTINSEIGSIFVLLHSRHFLLSHSFTQWKWKGNMRVCGCFFFPLTQCLTLFSITDI